MPRGYAMESGGDARARTKPSHRLHVISRVEGKSFAKVAERAPGLVLQTGLGKDLEIASDTL